MKHITILLIISFLFSVSVNSQEISGHFSFTISSKMQFNRAMGFGGEYIHKFKKTRLGITLNYSNIYKTIINSYVEDSTGNNIYENQFSNMISKGLSIFVLRNLRDNDKTRISFGPILGINYIRKLGSVQRFYKPEDFRFYNFFKYDDKYYQSEIGFIFETEIKEIIFKNISLVTRIKGFVSGVEFLNFSGQGAFSYVNIRYEMGILYNFHCKKKES